MFPGRNERVVITLQDRKILALFIHDVNFWFLAIKLRKYFSLVGVLNMKKSIRFKNLDTLHNRKRLLETDKYPKCLHRTG